MASDVLLFYIQLRFSYNGPDYHSTCTYSICTETAGHLVILHGQIKLCLDVVAAAVVLGGG